MGEFYIRRYKHLSVISDIRQPASACQQIIKPLYGVVNVILLFVGFPTSKPAMESFLKNLPVLNFYLKQGSV